MTAADGVTTAGAGATAAPARTIAAVVVNYNYARYLPDALDGLLAQTRAFDEIVVVDDGSTDDSADVLERYRGRVRVLRQTNSGQLAACLTGLRAVGSDYVYFLDADDHVRPELVESVLPALAGDPVKVQFQLRSSSGAGAPSAAFPDCPGGYDAAAMRLDNELLGFYLCPPTSGNVYRRAALLALRTDHLDMRDFIDGPITLALPYLGEVAVVPRVLATYRVHGGNHSRTVREGARLPAYEIDWFHRRWSQATTLAGDAAPAFGRPPLYVLERELEIAALEGRSTVPRHAWRHLRAVLRSRLTGRRKLLLGGWSVALALPGRDRRTRLARQRRTPESRSTGARRAVRLLLDRRRTTTHPTAGGAQ